MSLSSWLVCSWQSQAQRHSAVDASMNNIDFKSQIRTGLGPMAAIDIYLCRTLMSFQGSGNHRHAETLIVLLASHCGIIRGCEIRTSTLQNPEDQELIAAAHQDGKRYVAQRSLNVCLSSLTNVSTQYTNLAKYFDPSQCVEVWAYGKRRSQSCCKVVKRARRSSFFNRWMRVQKSGHTRTPSLLASSVIPGK